MSLPDADLAKLLYRDEISIKHGSRSRLAEELEKKQERSASSAVQTGQQAITEGKETFGALSRALVQYLLKVEGWNTQNRI